MTQKRTFAVLSCKDVVRKAKCSLEVNWARDVNINKKGLYKYMNSKGRTRDGVSALLIRAGELVTNDTEKAEVLNLFCDSVCQLKESFRNPRSLRPEKGKSGKRKPYTQ